MRARAVTETHRTATPLELLFDLTFVGAIGEVAVRLANGILAGHAVAAIGPFLMVFFAIWWAWMNFTWFASAYDCDDIAYRAAAFIHIAGVLVIAAGTGRASVGDFTAITLGYVVMRAGLVALWLRAALQNVEGRPTALRYAIGIVTLQALWLARAVVAGEHLPGLATFVVLALLELWVPVWAERSGETNWHPHHIAERYSLFAIILLGESTLAATHAATIGVDRGGSTALTAIAASALVIVAAVWWVLFAVPAGGGLERHRTWSFVWGYGYYLPFAAMAALGGSLQVALLTAGRPEMRLSPDAGGHHASVSPAVAVTALAISVGVTIVSIRLLRVPEPGAGPRRFVSAIAQGVVLPLLLAATVVIGARVGLSAGVMGVAVVAVAAAAVDAALLRRSPRSRYVSR